MRLACRDGGFFDAEVNFQKPPLGTNSRLRVASGGVLSSSFMPRPHPGTTGMPALDRTGWPGAHGGSGATRRLDRSRWQIWVAQEVAPSPQAASEVAAARATNLTGGASEADRSLSARFASGLGRGSSRQ
jgi:hypothetical protein